MPLGKFQKITLSEIESEGIFSDYHPLMLLWTQIVAITCMSISKHVCSYSTIVDLNICAISYLL